MRYLAYLIVGWWVVLAIVADRSASAAELRIVGVLGNTSGMSDRPFPYAYYAGIGLDAHGRLYLVGNAQGVAVSDQDGRCLATLPLPDAGFVANSLVAREGDTLFFIATSPNAAKSALYQIDTRGDDATRMHVARIADGLGHWAISPTPDALGRIIVGRSEVSKLRYSVVAIDPATGKEQLLFALAEPKGTQTPWRHLIQTEADGSVCISHSGGANFQGRFDRLGNRLGDALGGQAFDGFRYHFGYDGALRRMDLSDEKASPGDCGSPAPEIRMPTQIVRAGDRFFLSGRGGAVEARFNGVNFVYTRRLGGSHIEDMFSAGADLAAVAFTEAGNNDVQHLVRISKEQPIGQLLNVGTPLHGMNVAAMVEAPEGTVVVTVTRKSAAVKYIGPAKHLEYSLDLPAVQSVGQAAVRGGQLLLADPKAGVIWTRPLLDKKSPSAQWRSDTPGVRALACEGDAIFMATATSVARLSTDGRDVLWRTEDVYQGIRRLAASGEFVYVCDTVGSIVDQLDAATGKRLARLGTQGHAGPSLTELDHPYAVAADANGVYIADNGNGRIVVATTSLWRPEIEALPRDEGGPIIAVTIPAKPPAPGRISLNVYDGHDVTVRQLACAQPANQPITWDGRDLYGHWAQPGTYRYHGIVAPKLSLKYVTSVEQSGVPAYRTADGTGSWGGVWGYVMGICPVSAEPDSDIVVLWAFEEGEGGLIRMSQDGKVRWKAHLDWWMKAQQMAVACDGTSVYIVGASAMNAPQGQAKYGGEYSRPLLWRVDAATGSRRPFPGTDQQNQRMFGQYVKGNRVASDVAYHDGKLFIAAPSQNTLFVADATTGNELEAWNVQDVSGVAFDASGALVAGSGTHLVRLDRQGRVSRILADAGGEIWGVRTAGGGAFVASVAGNRNQVVYFDGDGHEIRALGQRGGRPKCGKMLPDSFRDPVGLCVAGNGKLFVAESAAPGRFTRWSSDGKLERQFHGPYYYSGMFGVDEDDPQYLYGDTHGDIIRYKLDYQTGAWDVDRYWIGVYQDTAVPAKWWPRIRHRDGKTYWCSGSGAIVELADDHARGVAAIYCGWVKKTLDGNYEPVGSREKTRLRGTWSDLNGDGIKQPQEWNVTDKSPYPADAGGPQQGWGAYFDEQFNCYLHDWSDNDAGGIWELPVSEWKQGTPIYRWEQARHVGLPLGHGLLHGGSGARTAFAAGDAVYGFNGAYNAAHLPGVGHGADWEFSQITQYDAATGKPLWHAGERAAGFAAAGQMYCPTGSAGIIGDYLFWTDENSLVHAWEVRHGLYVDTLLEDGQRGPTPSPYTVWVELFNTRVFKHRTTGKVYLLAASDAIHVFEVLGTARPAIPFDGEIQLTQADLDRAQAAAASKSATRERTLGIPRVAGSMTIDGNLDQFAKAPAAVMNLRDGARGTARLMHDDRNLYVAFDVIDDSPWKNAGSDLSTLFKTGDCVDLWVGPSAGNRPAGIGDTRILFAPVGGKPVAVAFRPRVDKGARPVPFRSPSGQVTIDKVEPLPDVRVAVRTTAIGYRLEAAVPYSDLGLDAGAERIGLDLSINFSDPAGQRNVARIHWGRNGAAMVYDLPSEARLEPRTWGVGILEK